MAAINVNRENPDQFYRYKMPSLLAKVCGIMSAGCWRSFLVNCLLLCVVSEHELSCVGSIPLHYQH